MEFVQASAQLYAVTDLQTDGGPDNSSTASNTNTLPVTQWETVHLTPSPPWSPLPHPPFRGGRIWQQSGGNLSTKVSQLKTDLDQ